MRRPIGLLLAVAVLTTVAVVAIVARSRPDDSFGKGKAAPNLAGTTLEGQPFDLASLRGHPVVINFWASWCIPCQQEMPLLATKVAAHAGSGLAVVGVLSSDTVENGLAFEKKYGATWTSVFDPNEALIRAYRVLGRPQSFFVDRNGILQSIQIGYLTDADFERQFALIAGGS
jgi:cytochrome c biogenesis protein CcmG/thiol:disulfide interchange protein DsbE